MVRQWELTVNTLQLRWCATAQAGSSGLWTPPVGEVEGLLHAAAVVHISVQDAILGFCDILEACGYSAQKPTCR